VLFLFGGLIQTYLLNRRIEDVRSQITGVFQAAFPDKKVTHAPLEQMRAEIKAGKDTTLFVEDTGSHVRAVDMLNEISRTIPPEIDGKFTKLVFGAGTVLVTGNTDTFNAVDDMKNRLESSDMFKSVTISSATMDRSGKRVEFKLKIDLS
jgi:general secretion pathway protein L